MTEDERPPADEVPEALEIITYRKALERAWADGVITADEEAMLLGLQEALSITPAQHQMLEDQVKAERLIAIISDEMSMGAGDPLEMPEGAPGIDVAQEELDRLKDGFEGLRLAHSTGALTDEAQSAFTSASQALQDGNLETFRENLEAGHTRLKSAREGKKFQDRLVKAKMTISSAEKLGVDIGKADQLVDAAVLAAGKGDLPLALRYVKGAREEANDGKKKLWSYLQIKRLERSIEVERFKGVMLLESQEALSKVEAAIHDKESINIRELVINAENVISANATLSKMRGEMDRLKGRIGDLAGLEVDTGGISERHLALQEFWLQDDVENARALTDKLILEVAEAQERFLTEDAIDKAVTVVERCRDAGADAGELEVKLGEARDSLEKKDFQRGRLLAINAQRDGEVMRVRTGRKRSKECIVNIQELIDHTDLPEGKMDELMERVSRARTEMDEGDFDGCMTTIRTVASQFQQESEDLQKGEAQVKADRAMAGFTDLIAAAAGTGVDTVHAGKALEDARGIYGRGEYRKAVEVTRQARYELVRPRSGLLGTGIAATFREGHKTMELAGEEGADIAEADKMLAEAETLLFQEGAGGQAQALVELVVEEAGKARRRKLADTTGKKIRSIHKVIDEAREMGLEVNEAEDMLSRAEALFLEQEDLDSSRRLAETAMEMVEERERRQHREAARVVIDEAVTAIDETRAAGGEFEEARNLLAVAESQFDDEDFEAVEQFAVRAKDIADTQRVQVETTAVEGDLKDMKERLADMENEGMEVNLAIDMVAEAESLFDGGDISGAREVVERAGAKAASTRTVYEGQMARGALLSARSSMLDAKEVHADTSHLLEKYAYARSLADDGKFREAEDAAMQLEQEAVEIRVEAERAGTQKIASEAIELARTRLGEALEVGVGEEDEARITGLIGQAEAALGEEGDADEAILIAEEAQVISEKAALKQDEGRLGTFDTLEAVFAGMARYGVEVEKANDLLTKVRTAREEGDLAGARDLMNELGGIMMAQGRAGAAVAAGRAGGEPGDGAAGAAAAGPGIMTRDQHEVAGHLTEVRFALEELSRLGGDTGDIKEAVANAETALMEGNPGKSLDILDKAGANVQERLEDVYRVRAQEALKTVRIMVEKRKADGSSSPALEAGLADMLDVYRNGGLEGLRTLRAKADELTQRNKAELEVQVQEELTRRAAQVTVKVAEVMEQGGQIVEVDNLLQMANAARSKGDIGEASALINRAEQEVDEVWLLMKRTDMLVELESIRWMFLKLKKAGANVAQMGSAIVAATKALERAEVDKAASFCARARTLLNSTTGPFMEQLVHINIQELKAIAVEFQAGGEDPALLLGLIQKAESELGSGDISGAMVSTVGAKGIVGRRELEESTGKQHEQVSRIKVRILHLADGGLYMKVPLTLHTELVQSLRKGRMDEVQRGMENLLHLANDIQAGFSKERAKEIISTVERLLGHLHKHHPDSAVHTANGEVILKNARKMMEKGSFEYAERYATRAREFILDITDEEISGVTQAFLYGRVEEAIEELEELISYLKKHNIAKEEVGAVEGHLQQARDLRADRGRILDAEAAIQKGSAAGLRLKNDYLRNKVVKALNRFTALVEQGRKAGKDTSKVESVCRKAREHMKRLDFGTALVELEKLAGR